MFYYFIEKFCYLPHEKRWESNIVLLAKTGLELLVQPTILRKRVLIILTVL